MLQSCLDLYTINLVPEIIATLLYNKITGCKNIVVDFVRIGYKFICSMVRQTFWFPMWHCA
jgi:hypothetical protein